MPSRRHVLTILGAGATGLAGCVGTPEGDETSTVPPTDTTTDRTTDETSTEEPSTTQDDPEPVADPCDTTWDGESVASLGNELSFGRPVSGAERIYVGSTGGLLALTPDLVVDWRRSTGDYNVSTVTENVVLAARADQVTAFDIDDGETLWTFEPPGIHPRIAWGPAIHDGIVYVAASQVATPETDPEIEYGRLYGIDLATDTETFVSDLAPAGQEHVQVDSLIADAAGVFVTLESGGLLGIDHDGTVRWRREGSDWYYPPARVGDLVLQPRSRSVVAVSAATGETQWKTTTIEMNVAVANDTVYGTGGGGPDENGTLASIDADTGESEWETPIPGCGRLPVVGSGALAIPIGCRGGPGHVGLYAAETGCKYGAYTQPEDRTPEIAMAHGRLYASVGDRRDRLLLFSLP